MRTFIRSIWGIIKLVLCEDILRNDYIVVSKRCSFGHQIALFDCAARLFHPNPVTVIWRETDRTNPYLPECFKNVFAIKVEFQFRTLSLSIFRFIVSLFGITVLEQDFFFHLFSQRKGLIQLLDREGRPYSPNDHTGYTYLVRRGIGNNPRFPQTLNWEALDARQKWGNRKTAVLCLRNMETDKIRNCNNQFNYKNVVKYLCELNWNVILMGDCKLIAFHPELFHEDEHVFHISDFKNSRLMDLYFFTNADLFIGQHSGPVWLASSAGVPCVLCECIYTWQGTHNPEDVMIFKPCDSDDILNAVKKRLQKLEEKNHAATLSTREEIIS